MKKKINVGGQAVMEGVMMRSPNYYAVAARNEKGKIKIKTEKLKKRSKFLKLMFIHTAILLNILSFCIISYWSIQNLKIE